LGSKRRVAVAVLLFLQALLYFFYSFFTFIGNVSERSGPASATQVGYIEFLAAFLTVLLGIFVWRGSRIALIVTTIVSVVELLLVVPYALVSTVWGLAGLIFVLVLFPLAPSVLALPILILCLSSPMSRPAT
jgi:hypothetical protein